MQLTFKDVPRRKIYSKNKKRKSRKSKSPYFQRLFVLEACFYCNTPLGRKKGFARISVFPGDIGMVVPVGRGGGVGIFKGMLLGNFPVRNLKGKDLMAGQMWKDLGLKVPH